MVSMGNEKLPPRGILTVGIIQRVPLTTFTTILKHHHHGEAVCSFYGVGSMNLPNLMQVTSYKGVGRGSRVLWLGLV